MNNNHFLVLSSFLFLVPIIYYIKNFNNNNFEIFLVFLLLMNFIFSGLFWKDGKYKSNIHKLDALSAKFSGVCFFLYFIFLKENCPKTRKFILLLIMVCVLLLFYISDQCSKRSWCSRKHIIVHSIFHLSIMIATLYIFM